MRAALPSFSTRRLRSRYPLVFTRLPACFGRALKVLVPGRLVASDRRIVHRDPSGFSIITERIVGPCLEFPARRFA
jgi:hypothetical protein